MLGTLLLKGDAVALVALLTCDPEHVSYVRRQVANVSRQVTYVSNGVFKGLSNA